jgi:hypothetical protein
MMQFGIVEGMTFRARFDEGVGLIIEPNPSLNRMACNAVPVPSQAPRRIKPRASGRWVAKPVHVPW